MKLSRWLVVLALLGIPGSSIAKNPIYDYVSKCELKQLAALHGVKKGKLKKQLKERIANGETKSLPWEIEKARGIPVRCSYAQTGLTTADAETLAAFWGMDVESVETLVELKFSNGLAQEIWWALDDSKYGKGYYDAYYDGGEGGYYDPYYGEGYEYDPVEAEISKFLSSRYHYCDARVLAEVWGTDVYEAKATIGRKLGYGDDYSLSYLDGEIARGHVQASSMGRICDWSELSYTYDDAYALAAFWGMDTWDAKLRIADAVSRGRDLDIRQQLRMARGY